MGWQGWTRLVLRVVFGLIFLAAGIAKLAGAPMMVQEFGLFASYGIGQWFRIVTGLIEITGALLLVNRRTVAFGAILLCCVATGAGIAQAIVIHQDVIHTIVFVVLIAWMGWGYRNAIVRDRIAA